MEEDEKTAQERYESLKLDLPKFKEIAEDFDIEKAFEKDSSFLLRDIRHAMTEKITAYSQLFETFQNPGSAPMFILNLLRNTTEKERATVTEVYNKLAKIQIDSIKLDTVYKESNEVVFIKETFNTWQTLKREILNLIEKLDKESNKESAKQERGYFG